MRSVRTYPEDGIRGMIHRELGQAQRFLRLLALGDVAADPHQSHDFSLAVFQRHFARQNGSRIAGRVLVGFVFVQQRLPRSQQFFLGGTILRRDVPRVKVVIGLSQEIIWRRRAHGARRSEIGRHEPALDVFHVDQVRQIVDQRAKKVVLLCERLPRPVFAR